MAISRGLRKKSKAKAELEAKKKALAIANPAPARRKKKKRKSYSDSNVGGVRLHVRRKPVRNRAIQRQKRQAIKEKKRLKKQQHKVQEKVKAKVPKVKQDDTDVIDTTPSTPTVEVTPSEPVPSESKPMSDEDKERLRQYESNGDSESDEEKQRAREEDTPEDSPWTDYDDKWRQSWLAGKEAENDAISDAPKNYIDDVMYSTFDALLTEMGAFDETLQDIVHQSIEMYGFTEAMNRLEAYMQDLYGRNSVFDIPLNYKDPVLKGIARFIKDMWGRPMSLAESEMYERKLDYLWTDPAYNNR